MPDTHPSGDQIFPVRGDFATRAYVDQAGYRARYVPAREVIHRPRQTIGALAAQRAGYGGSAVPLAARPGAAVAPLRLGRHTTAVWLLALLRPGAATAALATSLAIVARHGTDRDARISQAEAHAREVELQAAADAKRVKLEAEAQATRAQQLGEAEAAATKARGLAEGEAVKAKGLAEADAIKARADALAANQEAVVAQQIAEQLPLIVGEAAKAFGSIGQLTVLNGAEGFGQMFSQVLGMGASAIPMLRGLLDQPAAENGAKGIASPKPKTEEREP